MLIEALFVRAKHWEHKSPFINEQINSGTSIKWTNTYQLMDESQTN